MLIIIYVIHEQNYLAYKRVENEPIFKFLEQIEFVKKICH